MSLSIPSAVPHAWTADVLLVWGKTDPAMNSWLPLVRHLEDSAAMGEVLFDRWLAPAQREVISAVVGSEHSARTLIAFLCGVHDIGKCAPAFAFKALEVPGFGFLHDRLRMAGFDFSPAVRVRPTSHGLIGQMVVADLLAERDPSQYRNAQDYGEIVGGHHGRNPQLADVGQIPPSHVGQGLWMQARREIWNGMVARTGASDHLDDWLATDLSTIAQMVLSAVVIVADWMASNTKLFPYDDRPTAERLTSALEAINLPAPWRPQDTGETADDRLGARFPRLRGRSAQPIQTEVLKACQEMAEPSMLIIEAPMGCGKTEAAMLGAEVLAERFGLAGTFFGLPTMATANPMFARVRSWLEQVPVGEATTLNLVHSKAALNDDFADLIQQSKVAGISDEGACDRVGSAVTVASWFWGRKRSALATHVVGTIDQALFAGLKAKHVVLRHLALTGKVVIIDEVHAADDYMRVYLQCVLTWLGAYGTPVILMSATLPPGQRRELAEAYARGRADKRVAFGEDPGSGYPRLTIVGREPVVRPVVQPTERQRVRMLPHVSEVGAVADTVVGLLAGGGCAGIICNTVRRAQEVYERLRDAFGDDVRLVHSKYVAPHRAALESRLVADLGPDSSSRPRRVVVVGTQVLEQSLDIDFDVLVTDVAPMDLLMQRIGRLHRHRRGVQESDRPPGLRVPTCLVTGDDLAATPPALDAGSVAVYGASPLLRTLAVLGTSETEVTLPHDIPTLVSAAYDADLASPEGWQAAWSEAEQKAETRRHDRAHRAKSYLLASPVVDAGLGGLIDHEAQDPDSPRAAAQVRDTEESLEVVVIRRDADGQLRVLEDVGEQSGWIIPSQLADHDQPARSVAACTVTLPGVFTRQFRVFDETLEALEKALDTCGWQRSAWLAGQLFLVLDPQGHAHIGDRTVAYDAQLGLRVLEEDT